MKGQADMEHATDTPTPMEDWDTEELAYLEEQPQMMFFTRRETQTEMLEAIGAPRVSEWYTNQLGQIQGILDDRGVPQHVGGAGVPIGY